MPGGPTKAAAQAARLTVARPRTRLAGALRRLEDALASDPRELGRLAREFTARFHAYSPLNRLLILAQKPDATFVKGRKQWAEREGRAVRLGTRAIHVLAPVLKPGERQPVAAFAPVAVFDVVDTDGPPFRPPGIVALPAAEELVARRLADLAAWVQGSGLELRYGSPVVNRLVDGATDGRTIWVRPDLPPDARLAVLAHEIAHVKLHFRKKDRGGVAILDDPDAPDPRAVRELEAELTAFLVLELSGIDSSQGSAAYLANWNATRKEVRERAERCLVVACSVVRGCERKQYRKLLDEGPATLPKETRAALG